MSYFQIGSTFIDFCLHNSLNTDLITLLRNAHVTAKCILFDKICNATTNLKDKLNRVVT